MVATEEQQRRSWDARSARSVARSYRRAPYPTVSVEGSPRIRSLAPSNEGSCEGCGRRARTAAGAGVGEGAEAAAGRSPAAHGDAPTEAGGVASRPPRRSTSRKSSTEEAFPQQRRSRGAGSRVRQASPPYAPARATPGTSPSRASRRRAQPSTPRRRTSSCRPTSHRRTGCARRHPPCHP